MFLVERKYVLIKKITLFVEILHPKKSLHFCAGFAMVKKIILLLFLASWQTSCASFWQLFGIEEAAKKTDSLPPQNLQNQENPPVEKIIKPETPPIKEMPTSCEQILQNLKMGRFSKTATADFFQLEVNAQAVFNEKTLTDWVIQSAEKIFLLTECQVKSVVFVASAEDEFLYQGVFLRDDFELFQNNKISKPEWIKRFEIKRMETLQVIKKKLKTAREQKNHQAAKKWVEKWIEKEPQHINARLILGNILLDNENFFEAIQVYETLLKEHPQTYLALFNLAYTKKKIGSFDEAIQLYEKIIKQFTELDSLQKDQVFIYLASAYLNNKQLQDAEKFLQKVTDTTDENYLVLQANLLRLNKQFEEAKKILQTFIDTESASDIIYYNLILIHLDLKELAAARELFKTLQELNKSMANELMFLGEAKQNNVPSQPIIKPVEQDKSDTPSALQKEHEQGQGL